MLGFHGTWAVLKLIGAPGPCQAVVAMEKEDSLGNEGSSRDSVDLITCLTLSIFPPPS
jgi:hypothetical protein